MDLLFKPLVLVTGFGPFENHPVNASWEAVKLMNKEEVEEKLNVELCRIELPVTYENVDEFVPALWETHEPKLMMHVGVSSIAEFVTLETQAHKKGYKRMDYLDKCPPDHVNPAEGAVRLQTRLDVERLCKEFNGACKEKAVPSSNAGRYLCEYIYYTSLSADNRRTLFVHVPDTHVISSADTARALEVLLGLCLRQIEEAEPEGNDVADGIGKVRLESDDDEEEGNEV